MLTKEELEDLHKRIDNLEAEKNIYKRDNIDLSLENAKLKEDKTSLLSANKKLKNNYGSVEGRSIRYQIDYNEAVTREKLLKEQLTQEKQLRAKVIIDYQKIVKTTNRTLEKQRKKNREKQALIVELRGY